MKISWRTLEREIADICKEHVPVVKQDGSTYIKIEPVDFTIMYSISVLAQQLAQRLES